MRNTSNFLVEVHSEAKVKRFLESILNPSLSNYYQNRSLALLFSKHRVGVLVGIITNTTSELISTVAMDRSYGSEKRPRPTDVEYNLPNE